MNFKSMFTMAVIRTVPAVIIAVILIGTATQTTNAQYAQCETKLLASDQGEYSNFGYSISLSDDVAIVGACDHNYNGVWSGTAYIARYDGTNWVEEATLIPSDPQDTQLFGWSVAISGDVAVVGSPYDEDNGPLSGSAFIYRYNGVNWIEETILLPDDFAADGQFGNAVSISGDVVVIGAWQHEHNGTSTGAAYVFRYDGNRWIQESELLASDGGAGDKFGQSVAISGDVIVVGAPDEQRGIPAGAAYIFRYDGNSWNQESQLTASDGAAGDKFGYSATISREVVVIGAVIGDGKVIDSGSAYIYRYDGSNWSEETKLFAHDGVSNDEFGFSVSISGEVVVVGAGYGNGLGVDSGCAYIYRMDGPYWIEAGKLLASDGEKYDFFGASVSCSGDVAVAGSPAVFDHDTGIYTGAVYFYNIDCQPSLYVTPDPLIGKQKGRFTVYSATPNKSTWLLYSTTGIGNGTYIAPLKVFVDLDNPQIAAGPTKTDSNGYLKWSSDMPAVNRPINIWFQVAQRLNITNSVESQIIP